MWVSVGPEGGDVRALARDPLRPERVYLGGAGGVLYRSETAGRSWERLTPGFPWRNQNLDELVVSPLGTLLVGFWDVHAQGGGVAISLDRGATFTLTLAGESVRALSLSPSDPNQVVAGSLNGVFASSDGGRSWRRITPPGHDELRNVESVAIDPRDPRIIYVGTWHLPWKTVDGGMNWRPVSRGMIEDSDVFTITLDRRNPDLVHATACSGIYSAPDGGDQWSRVRGLPFGSRRTRAFAQDLDRPGTFYAGTTEGLWVTLNDRKEWRPVTARDVVVNTIITLPGGSVLAGTDGFGVLRSEDHGRTWTPSNQGFRERFVSRIVFDRNPFASRVLASVWGNRTHGGVFSAGSPDGVWSLLGEGLKGREVHSLAIAGTRALAGTDQGLYALGPPDRIWRMLPLTAPLRGRAPRVNDLASLRGQTILAATSAGLFRSGDGGRAWNSMLTTHGDVSAVVLSPQGEVSFAATSSGLHESLDEGRTWAATASPGVARVNALTIIPGSTSIVLAATSAGLYRSTDHGRSWLLGARGLPSSDYTSLATTPDGAAIFVSDFSWGGVYRSLDLGVSWNRLGGRGQMTDRVWTLALDSASAGGLLAASPVGGLHLVEGWR